MDSFGLLPESEMEMLLHSSSGQVEVHSVLEDAISALPKYIHRGYTIVIEPFERNGGKCAVIQDASGTRICVWEKIGVHPEGIVHAGM